jgi:hypothetical protein
MTRTKLGLLTIGQAPRADALADDVQAVLGDAAEVVERGALDGLTFTRSPPSPRARPTTSW